MKIKISGIPVNGLQIDEAISLEALNARMHEGKETDINFTVAPQVKLLMRRTLSGAETKGYVSAKYKQSCALCLDEVERDVQVDANFVLKPKPSGYRAQGASGFDDDIGVIYYEDDYVDLQNIIQETLILSLTLYWHPPSDKSGNCTVCKRNSASLHLDNVPASESQRLADLLQKAGVKRNGN